MPTFLMYEAGSKASKGITLYAKHFEERFA